MSRVRFAGERELKKFGLRRLLRLTGGRSFPK